MEYTSRDKLTVIAITLMVDAYVSKLLLTVVAHLSGSVACLGLPLPGIRRVAVHRDEVLVHPAIALRLVRQLGLAREHALWLHRCARQLRLRLLQLLAFLAKVRRVPVALLD